MTVLKIKNSDVYPSYPGAAPGVPPVLNDILQQRMGRELGTLLRSIERRIEQQVKEIEAEHKRIINLYSPKDENGEPKQISLIKDMTDPVAYSEDTLALFEDTFEIEMIPESMIANMHNLLGITWNSPIIDMEKKPPKKEEVAGA